MGLFARIKRAFGRPRKAPVPLKTVQVRRPPVEVAAKELRTWSPPAEIVEGPLTPLEIVMAATERAVASAPPPPPPPPAPVAPTEVEARRRPVPGQRVVHLVFEDGSVVPGEETSEAARLTYLAANILEETRALSGRRP